MTRLVSRSRAAIADCSIGAGVLDASIVHEDLAAAEAVEALVRLEVGRLRWSLTKAVGIELQATEQPA